jgi:16S rRNA (uracil1498-N3)-methyltransferase
MTRRRFIADEVDGDKAALVGDHADHLVRVLRARVGQEFDISNGSNVRRGKITAVQPDRVEFGLFEEIPAVAGVELTLLLAIYKFDRMEWAVEKCTELGVARIIPVTSRRTDSHLAAASAKRVERWQRIARQASEQSRRAAPPEISGPVKLAQALKATEGLRIVLAESETRTQLRDLLEQKLLPDEAAGRRIALAIGPEGGWTDEELISFDRAGWLSASLGPTILRAETAAIAATAILMSTLSGK